MFTNPYSPPGYGFRPYPTPPQQAIQSPVAVQQSSVTMVTSRAQAEVAQVPFDGQPYFFLDTSSRRLYCKSFDPQTGLCPLMEYAPVTQEQPPQYATVEMLTALSQRVEEMAALIPTRKASRKEADAE
mgnify:CR=1 FL=1